MIGFNRRFDPNFASLQKRVADGAIGALEIVSITSRDPSPPPLSYIARSGGLFRDMMIHDFDMARFILGEEPVAVSAMGSALVDKAIGEAGDIDTAVVIMETKSGKVAQISNSRRASYGYDQRVEAHGDKGMVHAANVRETTVELAGAHGFTSDKVLNFFLERYERRLSQRTRRVRQRGARQASSRIPTARTASRPISWPTRPISRGRPSSAWRSADQSQDFGVDHGFSACARRAQAYRRRRVNRNKAWRTRRNDARPRTGRRAAAPPPDPPSSA